jgi:hypothetical protein
MPERWRMIEDAEADPDQWWVASIAKAFEHVERIALLDWLRVERGRQISAVTARREIPGIGKKMTSYQLKTLKDLGLVQSVGRQRADGSRGPRQEVFEFGRGPNAKLIDAVFDVASGRQRVTNLSVGEEGTTFRLTARQLSAIGKALAHPIRCSIVRDLLRDGELSPAAWAAENDLATSKANYHFLILAQQGAASIVRKTPVRAVVVHHYALTGDHAPATVAVLDVLDERAELIPVSRSDDDGEPVSGRKRAAAA